MKRESSQRQRPLFHEGPVWQQLDQRLRQQLVWRLADVCYLVVSSNQPSSDQEELHDRND